MTDAGRLLLAATPIGNPQDASPRLARALADSAIVAAEDTRRLQRLTAELGVRPAGRVVSYHEHNEASRTPELVAALRAGATVLVVTDAGMPSVSDPGYRLVTAALAHDVPVSCLPGPSAALAALAVSGLPVARFCFEGFLPRKPGDRVRALGLLAAEPRTMVFFEAPHRLPATLQAMADAFGPDRAAAVCRELTKTYEEVRRGPLVDLADWAAAGPVRGEITIVVAGAPAAPSDPEAELREVRRRVAAGERLKDACKAVAARTGSSSKQLYAAATADRDPASGDASAT